MIKIIRAIRYEFGHPDWDQYLMLVLVAALLFFAFVFSLLTFLAWAL